ncbi:MAG: hypothetical protein ABSH13_17430 [Candidatus Acidiferrum sp.]
MQFVRCAIRSFFSSNSYSAARRVFYLLVSLAIPAMIAAQETAAPEKPDAAVRAQMRNVKYRFSDKVAVQINFLNGALVPAGNSEFPILDDKNSFKIHIDTAEIAISPGDLANLLNSYVFAQPKSPLSGLSVSTANGQLKMKGRLHDKGDIPFESQGVLSPTPDGKLRLHSEKIKALHVPVKGLMDAFGIDVADLIKSGKVPGVQSDGNDLILDLEQMLPPPHIDGKVTAVRVETNSIIQTFGGTDSKPKPKLQRGNYMSYQGNRVRAGTVTMDDADVILYDMDPSDPMDFFLDHYKEQLAAGYTKISTSFQLRVFIKDFDKLGSAKAPAKNKEN